MSSRDNFLPPPTSKSPISRETVEIVKKKIGPPSGPPPTNLTGFKAPKSYSNTRATTSRFRGRDINDEEDDDEEYPSNDSSPRYADDRSYRENRAAYASRDRKQRRSYDEDDNDDRSYYEENDRDGYRDRDDDELDNIDAYYGSPSSAPSKPSRTSYSTEKSTAKESNWGRDRDTGHSPRTPLDEPKHAIRSPVDNRRDEKRSPYQYSAQKKSPINSVSNIMTAVTKDGYFNFQPLLKATYRDLRKFAWTSCEPGISVRCYIERDRGGITNGFSPYYSLCADMDDGTGRELMVCRKVWKSRSPHYIFSLKAEDLFRKREQRSRLYLGKLRGISPNEYVLYDNGFCSAPGSAPDDEEIGEDEIEAEERRRFSTAEDGSDNADESLYRKELAIICFNTKKRPPAPGERGTEICLLPRNQDGPHSDNKSSASKAPQSYVSTFRNIRETGKQNAVHRGKMVIIHEKTSKYDPLSACLVELKGRASVPSVKNCLFVMSDPASEPRTETQDDGKDFVLALGKSANDCFNMDYRYPLSLLQAFAICIARFDANLAWQK